jgi:oligopeptide transport system substrate-binding protein
MLRGKKPVIAVFTAAGLLAVAACGSSGGGSGGSTGGGGNNGDINLESLPVTPIDTRVGKAGGTFRLAEVEPTAIDPFNSQDSEGQLVTKNLFDTLTTFTVDGKVEKQLAQSYTHDATCLNWSFVLKPGQKFSNGETVDAESIKRGMTRTAIGTGASDIAYQLSPVKGFTELQASKETDPTKVDFTGVVANGLNLNMTLAAPDCQFDAEVGQIPYSPVPKEAGAASNTKYNDEPIGNGPFKLAEPWQHDKSITLVRNDSYTDGTKPLLDKVAITIQDGSDSSFEYKGLNNGDFDYARISPDDLEAAAKKYYSTDQAKNGFLKEQMFGINYLLVNVKNAPLNSVAAREAVSYAIDRAAIVKGVLKDSVTPATSLVSPPFAGQGTYQPGICASCLKQDPTKAKALAKQAGLGAGTEVSLAFNTGGGHEGWVQAVAGELEDVLGWKVDIKPGPFAELLKGESADSAAGLFRAAWSADYPSSRVFLEPLLKTQPADNPGDNRGRYSNKEFDALLAKGAAETDPAAAATDFKAAEKVAIGQDLALIPLWYRTQYRAFDDNKFVGVNLDFFENPTVRTIGSKPRPARAAGAPRGAPRPLLSRTGAARSR